MDNYTFWIWVAIAVLSFLFKNKKSITPPDSVDELPNKPNPITFEDLLREIQSQKEIQQAPAPKPQERTRFDDFVEEENAEKIDYSVRNYDHVVESYENEKQIAFHHPSLEETMSLSDTVMEYKRLTKYELNDRVSPTSEYVSDLKNQEQLKKAFVWSEIFKTKF